MPCPRCWRCWATWSPTGSRLTSSRFIAPHGRPRISSTHAAEPHALILEGRSGSSRDFRRWSCRHYPSLVAACLSSRSLLVVVRTTATAETGPVPARTSTFLESRIGLHDDARCCFSSRREALRRRARPADAHEAFLRVSQGYAELMGRNLEFQLGLIEATGSADPEGETAAEVELRLVSQRTSIASRTGHSRRDRARSRAVPGVRRRLDRRGAGRRVCPDRQPSDAGPAARRAAHARGPDRDDRGGERGR